MKKTNALCHELKQREGTGPSGTNMRNQVANQPTKQGKIIVVWM